MSSPLLTYSRLATLRQCPRKHYLRYELGLARDLPVDYHRLGGAFHRGLEVRNGGQEPAVAIGEAVQSYATVPPGADAYDWDIERETVAQLLAGYFWRYGDDELEIVAAEQTFRVPLRNPDTGATSRTFELAGKIDAIVRLPDGRLAVLEYKTAGEDIGPESDYWLRLRGDAQISIYVLAALALSAIATVLYKSLEIRDTTSSTKYPVANPHTGKFRAEVSRYLSNAQYPGYSDKAWYLLADPKDLPVIEVAFLNGQESPTIETADPDFNRLGVQMRGYHDFGVNLQEPSVGRVKMVPFTWGRGGVRAAE